MAESAGRGQAGASVWEVGGRAKDPMEEEVRRIIRTHADLSFKACFGWGCLFHKGTKEAARYFPEDHLKTQKAQRASKKPK